MDMFGIIQTTIQNVECKIGKLKVRNQAFLVSNSQIRHAIRHMPPAIQAMSTENQTLVHFRHFSSLLTNEIRSTKEYVRNYKLFLQNEPKFRKSQMNVSPGNTKDYDKMDTE
jgi:hypothetical protein